MIGTTRTACVEDLGWMDVQLRMGLATRHWILGLECMDLEFLFRDRLV
jgi:hypothetical protein